MTAQISLGSITKSSDTHDEDYAQHRRKLFQQRATAAHLLPNERVSKCGCWLTHNADYVELCYDHETEKAITCGVMVCGSVWHCPVCRERISIERRQEVIEAVQAWDAQGGRVIMMTLTISHDSSETCQEVLDRFTSIRSKFFDQRPVRRLMKSISYAGRIQNLETTHGFDNGWHVHGHALLFVEAGLIDEQVFELQQAWIDHVGRHQGSANLHGLHVFQPATGDEAASYLTKWGESSELTNDQSKKATGLRRNQWDILFDASLGDEQAANLFRQYANAFKGERYLYWSPRLKRKIFGDDTDVDTDTEEVSSSQVDTVGLVDWMTWQRIVDCGLQLVLLEEVERCGGDYTHMAAWFEAKGMRLYHRYEAHLLTDNLVEDYFTRLEGVYKLVGWLN